MKQQITAETESETWSKKTACDYRSEKCTAYGVVVGGRWICNNHICTQLQQCWLSAEANQASRLPQLAQQLIKRFEREYQDLTDGQFGSVETFPEVKRLRAVLGTKG